MSGRLCKALNGTAGLVGYSGALGTPTQGVLTNVTGLPISTGVSGLGTGVATALAASLNATGGVPSVPVAAAQMASGAANANLSAQGTGNLPTAALPVNYPSNTVNASGVAVGTNTFTVSSADAASITASILANGIQQAYYEADTTTSGLNTFTVSSAAAAALTVNEYIVSSAFPLGTQVSSIVGTTITATQNATTSGSANITFGWGVVSLNAQTPAGIFAATHVLNMPYISAVSGTTVYVVTADGNANATSTPAGGTMTLTLGINRVSVGWGSTNSGYVATSEASITRGLFGSAASLTNTTWMWQSLNSWEYPTQGIISLNDMGSPALEVGSHTANMTSGGHSSTYPVFIQVVNDNTQFANTVWGVYLQCQNQANAKLTQMFCAEITPVNYGAAAPTLDPYTANAGGSIDNWRLDAGGTGTNDISTVLHLIGNGGHARHGIDIDQTTLDFTSDSLAPAMTMPANGGLAWYSSAAHKGWEIYDDGTETTGTATTPAQSLHLSNTAATFSAPIVGPSSSVAAPAFQLGGATAGLSAPGGVPTISQAGVTSAQFGYNEVIFPNALTLGTATASCSTGTYAFPSGKFSEQITTMPASGTCTVTLPTALAVGQQFRVSDGVGTAATHNIVIQGTSANIDGAATYTGCNTNYCSWTGEWNGTIWKSVAKF